MTVTVMVTVGRLANDVCVGGGERDHVRRTQKLTSRFPLPPNSLSPVWKVTVMRSSLCRSSWKHSLEWARRRMLCEDATPIHPSNETSTVAAENRMVCPRSGTRRVGATFNWVFGRTRQNPPGDTLLGLLEN